ncbi:IclR family transcriptional regulator [Verminephrobacter eiseniae]|uniref:Transcriptional regulator, IclR family n=1 Tax=Verminephrobacter eiseniae (strain EF01-2) TaxID=391735 RepID=A1WKV6_VEREI|nr:IclR family transcriptional regulator [Verminephrobacter eiseniae]ABM58263.1 transcriptional regulator, IclR family [Verminephrobacter eiseniae EF01-2]MCW5283851.1 IclR family transcriptional regulator [Verminephrobacter eiseniae]MCW5301561.1 IclR family transcriptional regulator [Verminephrobacter eiseniae]MCW8180713.1 IclR family transcriptional regulator [Verminephrobacter eiseniae]MCW8192146.1 IclR family transcriptional regulator [Verminephrobacter eiseniae]
MPIREDDPQPARVAGSQVVQRIALLMRLVAAGQRSGLRLADLYRAADLERPTVHRLLQSLVAERLLRQDSHTHRYFLGPAMYEMGLAASPKLALRDICHPHLQRIAKLTGDTVFLTERSGLDGVCTDRAEGDAPIKVYVLEIGRRRPLTVGGGSAAILSAMDDEELNRVCRANLDRTLKKFPRYSEAVLRRCIGRGRSRGYIVRDLLEIPDVRTVALALRDPRGLPMAGISVSTIAPRLGDERAAQVAGWIRTAVDAIEAALAAYAPGAHRAGASAQPAPPGAGQALTP